MRFFKASEEEIARVAALIEAREAAAAPKTFTVYRDNLRVVRCFAELETQWRVDRFSGFFEGLDYAGVHAWLQINYPKRIHKRLMHDITLMERAAMAAMSEIRETKKGR